MGTLVLLTQDYRKGSFVIQKCVTCMNCYEVLKYKECSQVSETSCWINLWLSKFSLYNLEIYLLLANVCRLLPAAYEINFRYTLFCGVQKIRVWIKEWAWSTSTMRDTIWKKEIRLSPASDAFIFILLNFSKIMHGESKAKAVIHFSILGSYQQSQGDSSLF